MEIKKDLVSVLKYKLKCPHSMKATYITIHNTYNDAPAKNEISYMKSNSSSTSFHYAVDDLGAIQGIPLNRNAWHAGDGANGKGNRQSIGIEICYSKSGGSKFDKAVENAIELAARLMKEQNIPAANIVYHKHWSGKYCPHRLLDEGITIEKFRALVQAKYNEMYVKKPVNSFLTSKGYLRKGDKGENIRKINDFYYKVFPSYAKTLNRKAENVKGNYFGENTEAWTKEFQKRTKLTADGFIGPKTLNMLKKYGFKE